jgi:anaerobic magnesium-protoporphyrin IX monomethyl ester cyclase
MNVTFVGIGTEQLGISLLSSILRAEGHQTDLAFNAALFDDRYNLHVPWLARLLDDTGGVLDAIARQQPDVLAFSAVTNTYRWLVEVAAKAREMLPGVRVVFGGVHASVVPELVLDSGVVDFVCIGEGERALPRLLREIAAGGPSGPVDNILYRDEKGALVRGAIPGFIQNLDSLPPFDKHLWEDYIRVGDLYITMTSRGCPFRCVYCVNSFYSSLPDVPVAPSEYVRRRSAEHVLVELRRARRRYRLRCVDFVDDVFTSDKAWLRPFLRQYRREVGVPFTCLTRARFIDEEVAGWLRDAGCEWVQIGVQSVDDAFKRTHLNRLEDSEQIHRAMEALSARGIRIKCDHIFGLPGEPAENQEKAWHVYSELSPQRISTFWATYFPGTKMAEQALALGLISDEDIAAIRRGIVRPYHHSGIVRDEDMALYRSCELMFRLLPLLPRALRHRLSPRWLRPFPAGAAQLAGLAFDLINGLRTRNRDHLWYAAHYLYHFYRRLCDEIGATPRPATCIVEDGSYPGLSSAGSGCTAVTSRASATPRSCTSSAPSRSA